MYRKNRIYAGLFDNVNPVLYNAFIAFYNTKGVRNMRKTEMIFGLCAGAAGILIGVLSLVSLLPLQEAASVYPETLKAYAVVCIAANALGALGAILVQKRNIPGAVIMAASMLAILIFGFPWQTLPAVLYIISVVMATVPVKTAANIN